MIDATTSFSKRIFEISLKNNRLRWIHRYYALKSKNKKSNGFTEKRKNIFILFLRQYSTSTLHSITAIIIMLTKM